MKAMIRVLFCKISRAVLGGRRAEIRDLHRPTGVGIEFPDGISTDDATLVSASMMSLAAGLTGDPALGGFANGLMNSWAATQGAKMGAEMAKKRAASPDPLAPPHYSADVSRVAELYAPAEPEKPKKDEE